ncbi:tetratricopeptide repeat protein [uncultured Psychroserpens sp.]|uniref:tetratricopeptide repeat-containing sensor histidine kinase n=1 Tax=uncultured Psychroserpens sp. TaxID=255436 RepID=UPI0026332AA6|nr:tetratricopeptide repeat protein [uncultured Psychroserpens sp.]
MNFLKSLLFLYILFFSSVVIAQNKVIDSLINDVANHNKLDSTKVNLLYKVAFSSFQSNLDLTKLYLQRVEHLSDSLDYTKGKAKASYLRGILENRQSNYSKSLEFFEQSLKYYQFINDKSGIAAANSAIGITYFDQTEYEEGLKYYNRATEIFRELGEKENIRNSLIFVANVNTNLGNYDEAISKYKEALNLCEEENDEEGIVTIHSNMAVLYSYQGNYQLAVNYYTKGLLHEEKTKDTLGIAKKLNNLGDVYTAMDKYDTALEYLQRSLDYSTSINNKALMALNNINFGNIYKDKGQYTKSLKYYVESLKVNQEIKNQSQVAACHINIGEIYFLLNDINKSHDSFAEAKSISEKLNLKRELSYSLLGIAKALLAQNQFDRASDYAKKGKELADELELLDAQRIASELLSNIYEKTGDHKNALSNYRQFKILNDSIFNKENIEKITQLEYEYKYKQQIDSLNINELKLTKTIKATSQDLEDTQRNYLWAIIVVLLLSILLGAIMFNQKLKNAKSKTQTALMEQKLLRSQMTPHFIFNSLSVLQGMILNKEDNKSVQYLSKFSKLLRITLENSRDKTVLLSQELTAVQDYLTLQNLENDTCECTILVDNSVDVTLFDIPPMLIQPFVENAIEHAFVNMDVNPRIDIKLRYIDKKLVCTIADNGVGIDYQNGTKRKDKKSMATAITSERLRTLSKEFKTDGSIIIEDRKKYNEKGTLVTLVIPYKMNTVL